MTYLEDGVPRGLEVDLARELTRVIGREIRIELTDWGLAQKKLLSGEVDALIAMTMTEERKKIYDFTIPTFTHEFALFVLKEERRLNTLNSLEGKRVGVTPSGFPRKFMEARKGVIVVPTPTYETGMDELAAGKIDAFAGDLWVGAFVLRSRHIPDITIAGDSFAKLPSGFAVKKGNAALVSELNAALRVLEKEGVQKKIQKIWEPQEILFFSQQRLYEIILWSAGSVLLVLLAVMSVWIFTLQKQINSRRSAEESLRESEEKFRMVFSTIHDTVSISRVDTGEIIDTNGKGLGYTREEAIGKTGLQLGIWGSEEDRKRMIEAMAKQGQLSDFEIEFHRKNGPNWMGSLSSSYIFIRGRKYLLTVVRDITEKKKAEEQAQLQQARLQLANKMASLGILVAGVAHEINNPNSLIMLNTDLLQKIFAEIAPVLDLKLASDPDYQICGMPYAEIKPEIQRLLSGLTGASERILTTISGLKNFARVDNDKNKLEPVSLNEVVRSALTFTRNLILSSTQNFETELLPDLPVVLGNAHELEQVLINLITNACHAIKDKTEFLRIRTLVQGEDVVVEVEDGGLGIPAESLSHLFDPFFTTERDRGGTGLGLSVAYSIVESHRGKLSFKSEPILGTCATLSLPRLHG